MTQRPILASTMGDPAGIGPEICVRAALDVGLAVERAQEPRAEETRTSVLLAISRLRIQCTTGNASSTIQSLPRIWPAT